MALVCSALTVQAKDDVQIRRNQVGYFPQQEKVIVVEGQNPSGKIRVKTPEGKVLKPKVKRKAVSPWSGKTRYIVDLGALKSNGNYQVSVGDQQCLLKVNEHPYRDIATASLRLF